jgi:hypothetical protein
VWNASAPLLINGLILLAISPFLSYLVRKGIVGHYASLDKKPIPAHSKPAEIVNIALWSIDKYSCVLQMVATPILGLIFLSSSFTNLEYEIIMAAYVLTGLAMLFVFRIVNRRTPAVYAIDCVGQTVPKVGRVLRYVPIVKKTSWGVLACVGLLLFTSGLSAILVTITQPDSPRSNHIQINKVEKPYSEQQRREAEDHTP